MRLQAYHQSLHRLEALGVVHHIVTVPNSLRKKLYALPCDTVFVISLFISFMSMSDDSLVFICGVPLFGIYIKIILFYYSGKEGGRQ